ncbi:MAG: hypothetical protein A4E56_01889 [Pelotomaculum sp. PtaU1.Bin065]|nr:MAG: hypothetical protein A4E56_01889 [Pelotomaculum sp. PtaU1.Bin065]
MVARLEKQDDVLKAEFLKKIQAKIAAEKDSMKERLEDTVPSLISLVLKPVFGVAFDVRKWLNGTGKTKVNLPPEEWIKPVVVFTNASWLKTKIAACQFLTVH